jgi:uncharacterized protein YcbK (DUF882 family)
MEMTRRELLYWGGSAMLVSAFPLQVLSSFKRPLSKKLCLYNTHTGEFAKEEYWCKGIYCPNALKKINHLLRDHRSNEIKSISPALLNLLHTLQTMLGYTKPFEVSSGYRSLKTNEKLRKMGRKGVAKQSYHTRGMAIDVDFRGLSLARAHKAACFLSQSGGVGYYPSSHFIHLDVRGFPQRWTGV